MHFLLWRAAKHAEYYRFRYVFGEKVGLASLPVNQFQSHEEVPCQVVSLDEAKLEIDRLDFIARVRSSLLIPALLIASALRCPQCAIDSLASLPNVEVLFNLDYGVTLFSL